jgi:hypothetical protein
MKGFIFPLQKPTIVAHHGWISPSLLALFPFTYILVEPFPLFITSGTQVVRNQVQM